ncbi:hypothetical protein [Pseudomonas brassicacearum]|nr:hypothetical protein [Pseudomonas brassicacearum]
MTIAIRILDGLIGAKTGPSLAFSLFESQFMALDVFKSLTSQ